MAETKDNRFPVSVKMVGDTPGTFRGTLSTYGNLDRVGDVCEKGCFSNVEQGKRFPLLWQHDMCSPIGSFTVVDTEQALTIEGKLNLGTTLGKDAYALLKEGDLDGLSIGYSVNDCTWGDSGVRHLTSVCLHEGSLVTFPANEMATVGDVKSCRRKSLKDLDCLSNLSEEDRDKAVKEIEAYFADRGSEAESSEDEKSAEPTEEESEDQSGAPSEDKADESEDEEEKSSDSEGESESEEEKEDESEEEGDEEKSWSSCIEILTKSIQRF